MKCKTYTEEFKKLAVEQYENSSDSYVTISEKLGIRSPTQLKEWVKKVRNEEPLKDSRGKETSPLKGFQKTRFTSIEEERDYYKAQVAYLKKQYPNLHGEEKSKKQLDLKSSMS